MSDSILAKLHCNTLLNYILSQLLLKVFHSNNIVQLMTLNGFTIMESSWELTQRFWQCYKKCFSNEKNQTTTCSPHQLLFAKWILIKEKRRASKQWPLALLPKSGERGQWRAHGQSRWRFCKGTLEKQYSFWYSVIIFVFYSGDNDILVPFSCVIDL